MGYKAFYREWRPQSFAEVVGQEHIVRTLQNALKAGQIGHAYLFSGPRGTGKTSVAKILAKTVNCLNGPDIEPCNQM
jgi:DNA polymerase III subunit gamma/tau